MADGNLIVIVKEARNLKAMDLNGKSDPYVVLSLTSTAPLKTKVISKNLNPKWDEKFTYNVREPSSDLFIEVFDSDLIGKDDKLGYLNIPIASLAVSQNPIEKWFSLLGVNQGEILLSIHWKGDVGKREGEIAKEEKKRKVMILSLDGGGVRGLATAQFLSRLEEKIGKKVADVFDVFAGTSVGAIGAGWYATTGESSSSFLELYSPQNIRTIFPRSIEDRFFSVAQLKPLYDGKGKKQTLAQFLGEKKLEDTNKELLITSYNLRTRKFVLFSSSNNYRNLKVAQATDASSAAPAYFPSVYLSHTNPNNPNDPPEGDWYVDGGVVNNNPTITAHCYAKAKYGNDVATFILSIGTGSNSLPINGEAAQDWGGIEWLRNDLLGLTMDESVAEYQAELLLSSDDKVMKYLRVNSHLFGASSHLDDISDENLEKLKELGDSWFSTFGDSAAELINAYLAY